MMTILRFLTWILKLVIKLLLIPVIVVLTLVQWSCIVAVSLASTILDLIGGFFIVTGVLIYLMGLYPVRAMWEMIIAGAVLCILPMVGKWGAVQVAYLNLLARHWLTT